MRYCFKSLFGAHLNHCASTQCSANLPPRFSAPAKIDPRSEQGRRCELAQLSPYEYSDRYSDHNVNSGHKHFHHFGFTLLSIRGLRSSSSIVGVKSTPGSRASALQVGSSWGFRKSPGAGSLCTLISLPSTRGLRSSSSMVAFRSTAVGLQRPSGGDYS
jgi:hypothetical protein